MRRRVALLGVCGMVFCAGTFAIPGRVAASDRHYAPLIATFNAFGGNGNAFVDYNETVAAYLSANTIQTRMRSRRDDLLGLGLQELCASQYHNIWHELIYTWGSYGSMPYASEALGTIIPGLGVGVSAAHPQLNAACGPWFGNAVFARGHQEDARRSSAWYPDDGGSLRGYSCITTWYTVCTTHLSTRSQGDAASQALIYRDVGVYADAVNGTQATFMTGDFNIDACSLGGLWRISWEFDDYSESDGPIRCSTSGSSMQSTTDSGARIDYVWRRGGRFAFDAYVSPTTRSDHHWKEGYI
jgi:hypothetical protein